MKPRRPAGTVVGLLGGVALAAVGIAALDERYPDTNGADWWSAGSNGAWPENRRVPEFARGPIRSE